MVENRPEKRQRRKAIRYQDINVGKAADNILAIYALSTEQEKIDGRSWYDRALSHVTTLAESYNRTIATIAGIMSALSPEASLNQNIVDLGRVLESGKNATVSTYERNKDKAIAILDGSLPAENAFKRSTKTEAFWHNIINPSKPDYVTIDRHATRAAIDWNMKANDAIFYSNTPRKYSVISAAYTEAAGSLGMLPNRLQAITWLTYRRLFVTRKPADLYL